MTQKRPCDDGVRNDSLKHQRQVGPADGIIPCNEWKGAHFQKQSDSGEVSVENGELESHDQHVHGSCSEILREGVEKSENDAPRSAFLSDRANRSPSDEDEPSEETVYLPFYADYFSFDGQERSAIDRDGVYNCLLDYPLRKRVPVGPEHQAVLPACGTLGNHNTLERNSVENNDINLVGICLMSNAGTQPFADGEKIGDGRAKCRCSDKGSVRCVRQHIAEAREKLRRTLGPDTFMELGFNDMGEVVAEKWSLEEEHLFHEVVFSNPLSVGKKFWNTLSAVFPSRTKMNIVSYYFNVFMLRKRAEQNRGDLVSIDSDNDEWQGSDDGEDEGGPSEEDDNYGLESSVHHDGFKFCKKDLDVHEHEEYDGNISAEIQGTDGNDRMGQIQKYNTNSVCELSMKKSDADVGENDFQDGSCTSSDPGSSVQEAKTETVGCHEWHEFLLDSSDGKAWDDYNTHSSKCTVDFLPTCSMIEEVYGDGNFKSKDKRW